MAQLVASGACAAQLLPPEITSDIAGGIYAMLHRNIAHLRGDLLHRNSIGFRFDLKPNNRGIEPVNEGICLLPYIL
jgi:hypothetical protein